MKENIITLKIKYDVDKEAHDFILKAIKNYNNLLRFTYNRVQEGIKNIGELTTLQKNMNGIFLDSWFKCSAIYNTKEYNHQKVIFGSKKLFLNRCQNKISAEEFRIKRCVPLLSVGDANTHSNRKFRIINNSRIIFQPSYYNKIVLDLKVNKTYKKKLDSLRLLQNTCQIPITYRLDGEYVYISFDNTAIQKSFYKTKKNRVIAIDLNPNYLGYSVIDWLNENDYKIIDTGVFSLKAINDKQSLISESSDSKTNKYLTNKRNYEIFKISHKLANICKIYHCEVFAIEALDMRAQNLNKGRVINRLVNNQWNRNKFISTLRKLINSSSTTLIEVKPEYSSILGNLIYRAENLPDMVLSSIEIGRRGYEFQNQYLLNNKERKKNIILPTLELVKERISQSLEELGLDPQFESYNELFSVLKNSKAKYRVLLEGLSPPRVFSKFHEKSKIVLYKFI